jgi:hypothetical protein
VSSRARIGLVVATLVELEGAGTQIGELTVEP